MSNNKKLHPDHDDIQERRGELTDNEKFYTSIAKVVSVISTLIEMTACVGGLVAGGILNSAALIAFGLSSLIGVLATWFVLWRFFGVSEGTPLYQIEAREKKADVGVAFGIFIIATAIVVESTVHLALHNSPSDAHIVEIICATSIAVYFTIGCVMMFVGYKLNSGTMKKDGICAFATTALCAGILISAEIYEKNPDVWWFDSALGYVVAVVLYGAGIYTLITEWKHKWWTKGFWRADDFSNVDHV
jgi:divalent metal cation (Fe/Co/Zn/Cd) transporter